MKVGIKHRIRAFVQEELASLHDLLDRIVNAINSNPYIEYEDMAVKTSISEFSVKLSTLNRTPQYYEIIKKSSAVDIYTSGAEKWTRNTLFLKATVANVNVTLRIS